MAKSNIITQTTSLLKETNKLTSKLGIKQISLRKEQKSEKDIYKADEKPISAIEKTNHVVIDTVDGAKLWLSSLESKSTSAWVPVIRQQLAVLESVESPSMSGMMVGSVLQCLSDSLSSASGDKEKSEIRQAVTSIIQNYVFLSEAKLKYAQDKNKEEAKQLLTQAGNMMSSSLSSMAAGAVSGGSSVVVGNILNSFTADSGFFSKLGSFFASKKILAEKQHDFKSFVEGLFETFDKFPELFGKSIAINEMLSNYRRKLVEWHTEEMMTPIKSRVSMVDIDNLEKVTGELADSLSNASKRGILTAVSGFVKSVSSFVIDKTVRKKAAQLDVQSFCLLWDSCEKDISDLKDEISTETARLKELKLQRKEIGLLNFSQRKDSQSSIDEQLALLEKRRLSLEEAESRLDQMKRLFPEAHSIKREIDGYEANLVRIENKYI